MKLAGKVLALTVILSCGSMVCVAASGARPAKTKTRPAKTATRPAARENVAFSITADKEEYAPGEPINITFNLKNNGSRAVYVNKRFNVSAETADPGNREVYFKISDPSGNIVPCKTDYDAGFPKSDYFELLEPAAQVSGERSFNLRGYFDLQAEGTYTANAVYANIYGKELGLDTIKGPLNAGPLQIKIAVPKTDNPPAPPAQTQ